MAHATKETYYKLMLLLMFLMLFFQIVPLLYYNKLLPDIIQNSNSIKYYVRFPYTILWKVCYIVVIPVTFSLFISPAIGKRIKKEDQPRMRNYYWLFSIPILIGVLDFSIFKFYNNIAYPLLFILHMFYGSRGFTKIGVSMNSEKPLAITSQKNLELMGLKYPVINDYGEHTYLHVHNPFQGMLVMGGAGAGKSASVIEPAIYQWVEQGATMLIYDFKGNPATLGLFAYNKWKETPETIKGIYKGKEVEWKKPTFHLLTFDQPWLSVRPNPISPKTLLSSFHTQAITDTLLISINRNWAQKRSEFFNGSALSLAHAIAERLRLSPELHPYCTLAHLIEIACYPDFSAMLNWVADDERVTAIISAFLTPLKLDAKEQLAGQVASLSIGVGKLKSPELYWIFGAEPEYQTSIDVNNPDDPKIISVSNNPVMSAGLSPVLSCVIRSALNEMNQAGKRPSAFVGDELPTIYLEKLSTIPATARSNGLVTVGGIQDVSQLKTAYDKEADEILSNLGNFFVGMTNNIDTAKRYGELFGTYKMVDPSNSTSSESISISEKHTNEKIFQPKDIAEQPIGHFVGKVAGGDPGMFSVQFKEFKKEEHFSSWTDKMDIEPSDEFIRNLFLGDQDYAKSTFKTIMDFNLERIQNDVALMLAPYVKQ